MDEEGSQVLRKIVEEQGVELLLESKVEDIVGDSIVKGCCLEDQGEVDTQLILFSAGVRCNMQLAKEIGIEAVSYTHLDVYKRQLLITGSKGIGKSTLLRQIIKSESSYGGIITLSLIHI